ncbi:UNVERIFIED_CONTAM: hypothetical protein Slati_1044000 [Sesamum latifolium]|uniref:Uncharacterized protein n=1 Tax=Sesamum latifolium TaxID=2727402 RepID=A0AAW2XSH9_9LAMI
MDWGRTLKGSTPTEDQKPSGWPERLKLHGEDHLGMSLVLVLWMETIFWHGVGQSDWLWAPSKSLDSLMEPTQNLQEVRMKQNSGNELIVWWFLGC